jgi:hypothetical protein
MRVIHVILVIGTVIGLLAAVLLIFVLLSSVELAVPMSRTVYRTLTRAELVGMLIVVLALTAMAIYALKTV